MEFLKPQQASFPLYMGKLFVDTLELEEGMTSFFWIIILKFAWKTADSITLFGQRFVYPVFGTASQVLTACSSQFFSGTGIQ